MPRIYETKAVYEHWITPAGVRDSNTPSVIEFAGKIQKEISIVLRVVCRDWP